MKIWQKLVTMCILFLIPTGIGLYFFVDMRNEKDINFSQKEYCGDQYNRKVMHIMGKVIALRIQSARSADSVSSSTTEIDGLMQDLEQQEQKACLGSTYQEDLGTASLAGDLKLAWNATKSAISRNDKKAIDETSGNTIHVLSKLNSHAGD